MKLPNTRGKQSQVKKNNNNRASTLGFVSSRMECLEARILLDADLGGALVDAADALDADPQSTETETQNDNLAVNAPMGAKESQNTPAEPNVEMAQAMAQEAISVEYIFVERMVAEHQTAYMTFTANEPQAVMAVDANDQPSEFTDQQGHHVKVIELHSDSQDAKSQIAETLANESQNISSVHILTMSQDGNMDMNLNQDAKELAQNIQQEVSKHTNVIFYGVSLSMGQVELDSVNQFTFDNSDAESNAEESPSSTAVDDSDTDFLDGFVVAGSEAFAEKVTEEVKSLLHDFAADNQIPDLSDLDKLKSIEGFENLNSLDEIISELKSTVNAIESSAEDGALTQDEITTLKTIQEVIGVNYEKLSILEKINHIFGHTADGNQPSLDLNKLNDIFSQWRDQDFSIIPEVKVVSHSVFANLLVTRHINDADLRPYKPKDPFAQYISYAENQENSDTTTYHVPDVYSLYIANSNTLLISEKLMAQAADIDGSQYNSAEAYEQAQKLAQKAYLQAEEAVLQGVGHSLDTQVNQVDSKGDEGAIFAHLVKGKNLPYAQVKGFHQSYSDEANISTILVNNEEISVEAAIKDLVPANDAKSLNASFPSHEAVDVPTNADIYLTFSDKIDVEGLVAFLTDQVDASVNVSRDHVLDNVIILSFTQGLKPNQLYSIIIPAGTKVVRDDGGLTAADSFSEYVALSFTTGQGPDYSKPVLENIIGAQYESETETQKLVFKPILTFDKPVYLNDPDATVHLIDKATGEKAYLKHKHSGIEFEGIKARLLKGFGTNTLSYDSDKLELFINESTEYYVDIAEGAFKDTLSNGIDTVDDADDVSIDSIGISPNLDGYSPTGSFSNVNYDEMQNVTVDATIITVEKNGIDKTFLSTNFNENIYLKRGTVNIINTETNAIIKTVDFSPWDGKLTGNGSKQINIQVDENLLDDDVNYQVEIISGFQTVSSFQPIELKLNFDENVFVNDGTLVIKRAGSDDVVASIDLSDENNAILGNGSKFITILPEEGLIERQVSYYVEIDADSFKDQYGNTYEGFFKASYQYRSDYNFYLLAIGDVPPRKSITDPFVEAPTEAVSADATLSGFGIIEITSYNIETNLNNDASSSLLASDENAETIQLANESSQSQETPFSPNAKVTVMAQNDTTTIAKPLVASTAATVNANTVSVNLGVNLSSEGSALSANPLSDKSYALASNEATSNLKIAILHPGNDMVQLEESSNPTLISPATKADADDESSQGVDATSAEANPMNTEVLTVNESVDFDMNDDIVSITTPEHGKLTLLGLGQYRYVADPGFSGTDSVIIQYKVDGQVKTRIIQFKVK